MNEELIRGILFIWILSMTACVKHVAPAPAIPSIPSGANPVPAISSDAEDDYALEYYNKLYSLSHADLQEEYSRLVKYRRDTNKIVYATQMALLLTVPENRAVVRGESRALELLDELSNFDYQDTDGIQRNYLQLGLLWRDILKQRQYFRDINKQLSDTKQQIEDLKTENNELKKQIEALKVIEQQINQQEQMRE